MAILSNCSSYKNLIFYIYLSKEPFFLGKNKEAFVALFLMPFFIDPYLYCTCAAFK